MKEHPLLGRRVTKREYERLLDYAVELGITNAFIQDRHVAKESFVPEWNLK
jgi:putative pyruvate formate lyase activating enzyme